MKKPISIAIDGPAASGKSTTARLLSERLGYIYIDTGAMYRAATLAVLRNSVDPSDEQAVAECVRQHTVSLRTIDGEQRTYLDGEDVSELIRTPQINTAISKVSAYVEVRRIMVEQQRMLAKDGGVVMDGRDIGTVVLPDAELKIFMVASLNERAQRRLKEQQAKGVSSSLEEVKADISRRDKIDASRSQAPLKKAEDAVELDTSQLTIEKQVEYIFKLAIEK